MIHRHVIHVEYLTWSHLQRAFYLPTRFTYHGMIILQKVRILLTRKTSQACGGKPVIDQVLAVDQHEPITCTTLLWWQTDLQSRIVWAVPSGMATQPQVDVTIRRPVFIVDTDRISPVHLSHLAKMVDGPWENKTPRKKKKITVWDVASEVSSEPMEPFRFVFNMSDDVWDIIQTHAPDGMTCWCPSPCRREWVRTSFDPRRWRRLVGLLWPLDTDPTRPWRTVPRLTSSTDSGPSDAIRSGCTTCIFWSVLEPVADRPVSSWRREWGRRGCWNSTFHHREIPRRMCHWCCPSYGGPNLRQTASTSVMSVKLFAHGVETHIRKVWSLCGGLQNHQIAFETPVVIDDGHGVKWVATAFHVKRLNAKRHGWGK